MKRYSRKREAILEAIRSCPSHPTAEWIYKELKPRFPDLSLATVYRNLNEFVSSGEIASIGVIDSKERYDKTTTPHSHFICSQCGAIYDVFTDEEPDFNTFVKDFELGSVTHCELTLRGICRKCLEASENT